MECRLAKYPDCQYLRSSPALLGSDRGLANDAGVLVAEHVGAQALQVQRPRSSAALRPHLERLADVGVSLRQRPAVHPGQVRPGLRALALDVGQPDVLDLMA